jgi:macrolide transport system ATP-binding/permease protein
VGANGTGKSTLLKILAGQESPDAGTVQLGSGVRLGVLAQTSPFDPTQIAYEAFRVGLEETEARLKAILISYGLFRYDDLNKRVGELSIGQQRKLQLARLIAQRANFLLLDEPTNDLSLDVVEGLEAALQDFGGAIIVATHDRQFLRRFQGEVWQLAAGKLHAVRV